MSVVVEGDTPAKKTASEYEDAAFQALLAKQKDKAAQVAVKKKAAMAAAKATVVATSGSGPAPPPKRRRLSKRTAASAPAPTSTVVTPAPASSADGVIGTDGSVYGVSDPELDIIKLLFPVLCDAGMHKPEKNWVSKCYRRVKIAQGDSVQGCLFGSAAYRIGKKVWTSAHLALMGSVDTNVRVKTCHGVVSEPLFQR